MPRCHLPSFDAVYEGAREESATQFARSVLGWELEKGMTAPLNLLSIPLSLLVFASDLVRQTAFARLLRGRYMKPPPSAFSIAFTLRRHAKPLPVVVTCGRYASPLRVAVTRRRYASPLRVAVTRRRYPSPLPIAVT